jgi:NTP pyrophosphatase (non-canonical NTP hydrolase)
MEFNKYQELASTTATYKEKIIYPTLGLNGEAGEIAEKVKKILRDKDGVFDEAFKLELAKELGDQLWYVAALASDLGLNLDDVAEMNIKKLASRKERGVIQGSGDNR